MNITISKHAAGQAAIRGITEDGIRAIATGLPGPIVTVPSPIDPFAEMVFGIYLDKIWCVVINSGTKNVITVRRARTKEEDYYAQKTGNRPGVL